MSFEIIGVRLVADNADKYFADMAKAQKAEDEFGKASAATFKQMPGLADIAVGALHKIGEVAVSALGAAAQATGQFLSDSVSKAGDFQSGMLEFQAVAGKDVDTKGLDKFHDLFIQLGKDLPVSTADVQQAAIELVKGGIDPATIAAGGLKQSIQFAAAAMDGDLAAAAETSAKIVGGWADVTATAQQKADLLTHATDLLTKAANASTVDVHDLALGLYNVQGTAKTTGLSLDETTTALAELAPRFANANTAGTSFRNFLIRLQPTTKPAIAAMQDLGLVSYDTQHSMQFLKERGFDTVGKSSDQIRAQLEKLADGMGLSGKKFDEFMASFSQSAFFDAQGKFVGVAKASQLLQDSLKGLTDAQKTQALQTIFGNDAMNAAAAFADLGAKGYDNMTASLDKANGVSENAALKQQGFNTALENAKGSVEALQITLGEKLLPVLTSLLNDVIAPAINAITTLSDALFGNREAFDKLSPAMQDVEKTLEQVWASIQTGIGLVQEVISWFQSAGSESSALSGVLADLSKVWTVLQTTITAVIGAYLQVVKAVLPIIQQFIQEHGTEISAFFKTTWDNIVQIITLALQLYKAIIVPILQFIAAFIQQHGDSIKLIISGTWKVVTGIIDAALTLIKGIIKIALDLVTGNWQQAWTDLKDMSARFVADILQVIEGGLDNLKGTFDAVVGAIRDIWHNFIGDAHGIGVDIIEGIAGGIKDAVQSVIDAAVDAVHRAVEAAKNAAGIGSPSKLFAVQIGMPVAHGIAAGIDAASPAIMNSLESALTRPAASPMALMAGSGATNNATYNQQHNVNLNYHTTYAPPASTSLAIAQALGSY